LTRVALVLLDYLPAKGPGILTNYLRISGYEAELFFALDKDFLFKLTDFAPNLLGLSLTSGKVDSGVRLADWAKSLFQGLYIVAGGPHPTFVPEIVCNSKIDFVVRGEGEISLVELCKAISQGRTTFEDIPNLAWRDSKNNLHLEKLADPIQDLDTLPFPDWKPYFAKPKLAAFYRQGFSTMTGRGCPYQCTYCYNYHLRNLYGKRRLIRSRSVENVMEEINEAREQYDVLSIRYDDDDLCMNAEYLEKFTDASVKHKGLPFSCNAFPSNVNEKNAELLKKAGCFLVSIGLESGDPIIREYVLGRKISDEQILYAARCLYKHGIKVETYSMFGIPGENMEKALATWRLNKKISPSFTPTSIFQPYPGTIVYERLKNADLLAEANEKFVDSYFQETVIRDPAMKNLLAIQKLLQALLWLRIPEWLGKAFISLGDNFMYRFIFWGFYFAGQVVSKKLSLKNSIWFAWISRPKKWKAPL